jgi:hypothetical protein
MIVREVWRKSAERKCIEEHVFIIFENSVLHCAAPIKIDGESGLLAICVEHCILSLVDHPREKVLSLGRTKYLVLLEMLHVLHSQSLETIARRKFQRLVPYSLN